MIIRSFVSEPCDSIQLEVLEGVSEAVSVSCSVSGCVPEPVLTLYTVPGSILAQTSSSTATASISLPDSAAIYCMVAVSGTNYTDTVHQYYTRYTKAVVRPYTGNSATTRYCHILPVIILIVLYLLYYH